MEGLHQQNMHLGITTAQWGQTGTRGSFFFIQLNNGKLEKIIGGKKKLNATTFLKPGLLEKPTPFF